MRCQRCTAENLEDSQFCTECGAPLHRRCPHCQADNLPLAKFCGACGTALTALGPAMPAALGDTSTQVAEEIRPAHPFLIGERKQVTVLFADLQGAMERLVDGAPRRPARRSTPCSNA
jgi:hypothetical protein